MPNEDESTKKRSNRSFNNIMTNLTGMIGDLQSSIYGTTDSEEIDAATKRFHEILNLELKTMNGSGKNGDDDMTSFISKLYSKNKRDSKIADIFNREMSSMTVGAEDATVGSFLNEAYKNKMIRQADINDIANQLSELNEAVNTMRDAVLTADIVDGRINREIKFDGIDKEKEKSYLSTIKMIEEKFEVPEKIKSFIVKKGLTLGEYYAIIMPYSKIFSDFMKNKRKYNVANMYSFESVNITEDQKKERENLPFLHNLADGNDTRTFIESCFDNADFGEEDKKVFAIKNGLSTVTDERKINDGIHNEFTEGMNKLLSHITVVNDFIPSQVIDEGIESLEYFKENYVDDSCEHFVEKKTNQIYSDNSFVKFMKNSNIETKSRADSSEGLTFEDDEKESNEFKDVKDCYFKMVEPTKMIEIKIMDECIGYFYIKTDNTIPISGILTSTLYQTKMNQRHAERGIVDDIAARIIQKFDRKFLKDNPKFKKIIVEALNYYDLTNQAITFQFIPKEYVVAFKIDKDEEGNGTSMLDNSLFYAKLYLMLLLFKMMSIILNSNDTKVNYIRHSGIDKDLINKVQQIAIQKQARNINIMDLFNYTSLINKIGQGNELFIPTGRSNDRPMETDILSGQDVQINNELMEFLRNNYILATGVPAAIMNYLNEADFAKSIEVANTKFNGRVVNYQLDFNPGLTDMYKLLLRFSSNIPEADIDKLVFALIPPKGAQNNIKQEQLQNFTTIMDFLVTLYFGDANDENGDAEAIKKFKIDLAKEWLTMFNFERVDEIYKDSKIKGTEETLRPKQEPANDDLLGI